MFPVFKVYNKVEMSRATKNWFLVLSFNFWFQLIQQIEHLTEKKIIVVHITFVQSELIDFFSCIERVKQLSKQCVQFV